MLVNLQVVIPILVGKYIYVSIKVTKWILQHACTVATSNIAARE